MLDQPLLCSVLVLLFHARSSWRPSPSGITLTVVCSTHSYGAERGLWGCDTASALLPRLWALPGMDPATEGENTHLGKERTD